MKCNDLDVDIKNFCECGSSVIKWLFILNTHRTKFNPSIFTAHKIHKVKYRPVKYFCFEEYLMFNFKDLSYDQVDADMRF